MTLKEPVNAVSHMVGAIASTFGLILLIIYSAIHAGAWHIASFSIFGLSLILMYASSSAYHAFNLSEKTMLSLRKIDHILIFILIAGTYTPFCLIPLRATPWGYCLFAVIWIFAFVGIILKGGTLDIPRWVSTSIYLIMGWICIIAIYPLINSVPTGCLVWTAFGGFFYSIGAIIYALKYPNPYPGVLGFHEIWHFHVLIGSYCHFWAMFKYLVYID